MLDQRDNESKRVLVTGGAGFVGSSLAVGLTRRHPEWEIVALDNLKRRGSELNLPRLAEAGVIFVHGDVRSQSDLLALDPVDSIVECSAEPSALAGSQGDLDYLLTSNLQGAYHCLELARRDGAQFVFLSTSRVYPYPALDALEFGESETRFELLPGQTSTGASERGIAEDFPLEGPRTLYGATKLAAELLIEEYRASFGLRTVVNRCGVIAGPWQMGKVDQGVFTFWMLAHYFDRPLSYIGYEGKGKQVRDLLHVEDLADLLASQLEDPASWADAKVNVGGGLECSLSLRETTEICEELTGRDLAVESSDATRPGDVRIYASDCTRLFGRTDWRPRRGAREILEDIYRWIAENEATVQGVLP